MIFKYNICLRFSGALPVIFISKAGQYNLMQVVSADSSTDASNPLLDKQSIKSCLTSIGLHKFHGVLKTPNTLSTVGYGSFVLVFHFIYMLRLKKRIEWIVLLPFRDCQKLFFVKFVFIFLQVCYTIVPSIVYR